MSGWRGGGKHKERKREGERERETESGHESVREKKEREISQTKITRQATV